MLYGTMETIPYETRLQATGVMTCRSWYVLAWAYGYNDIQQLCEELPKGSCALDLGAGASDFGHEVASRRPDITWVNFDYRYFNNEISEDDKAQISHMHTTAPKNVVYIGGDILDPPKRLRQMRFAKIFSYYMFPHILDFLGKEKATDAMQTALGLLDDAGKFSMGPNRYQDNGCWSVAKPSEILARATAEEMITRYTESWDDIVRREKSWQVVA